MDSALVTRLQEARQTVEAKRQERMRVEARYESFKTQVAEFRARLESEGIDPSKLEEAVEEARADFERTLNQLEQELNGTETPQAA
jgi:SMC interacting uncharacterized protein involved in chromosome segregation